MTVWPDHEWLTEPDATWLAAPHDRLEDVQADLFLTSQVSSPMVSRDALWLRYDRVLEGEAGVPQSFMLTNENVILAEFTVYLLDDRGRLISSHALGMNQSGLEQARAVERYQDRMLVPGPGEYHLVLRLFSSTPLAPALLVSPDSERERLNQNRLATDWVMLALSLAMFGFNAVLLYARSDATYRWFMVFHVFIVFYFSALTGYGHLFLPLSVVQFLSTHIMTMNFLLIFLIFSFSIPFLGKGAADGHLFRLPLVRTLQGVNLLCAMLSLVVPDFYLFIPLVLLQLVTFGPVLFICTLQIRRGYGPAAFLLGSVAVQIIGGAIGTATYAGQLPVSWFTLNAFFASTVIELLLMSFAVMSRMRFLETRQKQLLLQDPETGLPSRAYFSKVLSPNWTRLSAHMSEPVVVLIEIDGIRSMIRLLGPTVAHRLWMQATQRWNQFLLSQLGVMPLAGYEVSAGGSQQQQAAMVLWSRSSFMTVFDAADLTDLDATMAPMRVLVLEEDEHRFEVESRMAAYAVTDPSESLDELLRKLNVALITAERENHYIHYYTDQQNDFFIRQNELNRSLPQAIQRDQMRCHVQPIVDLGSGVAVGGELLLRWQHPTLGNVPPGEFIPLAEQTHGISSLTREVLRVAADWLLEHPDQRVSLSVNLSVLDLVTRVDGQDLAMRVAATDVDATRLKVEVTESVLMENPDACMAMLDQLRQLGCQISIDDFGTGYSSLAYLSRILPDEIKIDRAFISKLETSDLDRDIVAAIVRLARSMGAIVVAEGVELEATLSVCVELGCDRVQGYLIARPMPLPDFSDWLSVHSQSSGVMNST
ncbi:EAL domain-containing protein [Saccharospirillum impatiens]|uniref:EAL domain-containing protein n=1 Tax=Saccharospirillum impatiens TaxID=169438 RepID=UPI0003F7ACEB|nr:EAL domain-containing protein [Saccharospirillum impatiens]